MYWFHCPPIVLHLIDVQKFFILTPRDWSWDSILLTTVKRHTSRSSEHKIKQTLQRMQKTFWPLVPISCKKDYMIYFATMQCHLGCSLRYKNPWGYLGKTLSLIVRKIAKLLLVSSKIHQLKLARAVGHFPHAKELVHLAVESGYLLLIFTELIFGKLRREGKQM